MAAIACISSSSTAGRVAELLPQTCQSPADAGAVSMRIKCETRSGWRIAYSIASTPPHECPSTATDSSPKWPPDPVEVVDSERG